VLPSPTGTETDRWAYVDAAIATIAASGLVYEVGPLETSFEGDPERVWATARAAYEAARAAGAETTAGLLKFYEGGGGRAVSLRELTAAHRARG